MATTPRYDTLQEQVTDEFCRKVLGVFEQQADALPGKNITRPDLVYLIFGIRLTPTEAKNLTASNYDRQIRDAIEVLQVSGCKIVSSSGRPGYRLAANTAEVEAYISELEARRESLAVKIRAMRNPRPCTHLRRVRDADLKQGSLI